MQRTIVLLSGGLDSATVLGLARAEGLECYGLSFDYGQRHRIELDFARRQAESLGAARHLVLRVDLDKLGGSSLTTGAPVPPADPGREGIPSTYVPARNTIFLAHALAWAEVVGASRIDLGINAVDYSGYPDCRPEYLEAFRALANLATATGVEGRTRLTVHAPLLRLRKSEIIQKGIACSVDYGLTSSCYDPGSKGAPCRRCDSCAIRLNAFGELGIEDPALRRIV
ncbi:MAG: 7-cyano-7-deazaguanine synthase QueC [Gemmatimonadetes bacterium]|nr:7-cyano-7-deazaguanine synthase QueC [Gemmatimonadota bacterium]